MIGQKILGFLTGGFGEKLGGVIDQLVPDKDLARKLKSAYDTLVQTHAHEVEMLELEIEKTVIEQRGAAIQTEGASKHWLAANWRPLTMLTFVALIVARMFGLTAEAVTEDEYIKLWSLVQLGLGGYVIGRSAEKVVPGVVRAMKGDKS